MSEETYRAAGQGGVVSGLADGDFRSAGDGDGVARVKGRRPLVCERSACADQRHESSDEGEQSHNHAKLLGLGVIWDAPAVPGARTVAPGTRTRSAAVTPELTEIWPQVRTRLVGYLVARGVSSSDADDVVQDVAERLIRHRIDFIDADDLLRWCVPVARHASIDRHRRGARLVSVHALAEQPCADDLAETVGARMRVRRVVDGLAKLSHADRETLVDALHENGTAMDGATRVRRHRARKRLLELVGPAAVATAVVRAIRRFGRTGAAVVAPAAVAASFLISSGSGAVGAPTVAAMPPGQSPAAIAAHVPAPTTGTARRALPHGATVVAAPTRVTSRSGPPAPVRVYGHQRRAQDHGLVCVNSIPVFTNVCVGPQSRPL